jgi:hypothetical protein
MTRSDRRLERRGRGELHSIGCQQSPLAGAQVSARSPLSRASDAAVRNIGLTPVLSLVNDG